MPWRIAVPKRGSGVRSVRRPVVRRALRPYGWQGRVGACGSTSSTGSPMQRRLAGCRAAMDDQRVAQAAVATAEDALHQRPHSRTVVAFISGDFLRGARGGWRPARSDTGARATGLQSTPSRTRAGYADDENSIHRPAIRTGPDCPHLTSRYVFQYSEATFRCMQLRCTCCQAPPLSALDKANRS